MSSIRIHLAAAALLAALSMSACSSGGTGGPGGMAGSAPIAAAPVQGAPAGPERAGGAAGSAQAGTAGAGSAAGAQPGAAGAGPAASAIVRFGETDLDGNNVPDRLDAFIERSFPGNPEVARAARRYAELLTIEAYNTPPGAFATKSGTPKWYHALNCYVRQLRRAGKDLVDISLEFMSEPRAYNAYQRLSGAYSGNAFKAAPTLEQSCALANS